MSTLTKYYLISNLRIRLYKIFLYQRKRFRGIQIRCVFFLLLPPLLIVEKGNVEYTWEKRKYCNNSSGKKTPEMTFLKKLSIKKTDSSLSTVLAR